MTYRLLVILVSVLALGSCSLVRTKPVTKDFETRLGDFPVRDIPLHGKAEIRWNDYQIPFIKADNDRDAAFLLGMVHAHLRLGQMYIFREVVNHRLAKHAGPLATRIDHSLMAMDLFAATDEIIRRMDEPTKLWISAFVEGINLYQQRNTDLPAELKALKIEPQDWELKDIVKIGRMISADVNWFSWFSYLKLQDEPGWEGFWEKLLAGGGGNSLSHGTPDGEKAQTLNILGSILNGLSKSGSNAFVISPQKSTTNSAIMASDPHLGIMLPNMWLIAGYQSPSYHVLGMMFPALPMVLVGRNENISFSGTNMRSASSDLFELSPDEIDNLTTSEQTIKVRWWFDKKVRLRRSEIGPVISDAPLFEANGKTIAMRWVGHEYSDELGAALRMNRAKDWDGFVKSFGSYAVSGQNYLYADTKGNIGLLPAVKIPIRSYSEPARITLKSGDKSTAWQGFLTATELPNIYNPEIGFIASANNQPLKASTPLGFFFSSDDRIDRMNSYFSALDKVSMDDIRKLHTDTYVISSHLLAQKFVQLLQLTPQESRSKAHAEILGNLQDWDGYYTADSKAAVIFQILLMNYSAEYYTPRYDKAFARKIMASDGLAEMLLSDIESGSIETAIGIMDKAVRKTRRSINRHENWGEMHRMSLNHYFGRIPWIGSRYRYLEYPGAGTTNSLMKTAHNLTHKKHQSSYGANSRFVTFMHDDRENYFVLLGGQDGWLGSEGLYNQVPLWRDGQYIKIPFQWEDVEKDFTHLIRFD